MQRIEILSNCTLKREKRSGSLTSTHNTDYSKTSETQTYFEFENPTVDLRTLYVSLTEIVGICRFAGAVRRTYIDFNGRISLHLSSNKVVGELGTKSIGPIGYGKRTVKNVYQCSCFFYKHPPNRRLCHHLLHFVIKLVKPFHSRPTPTYRVRSSSE